MALAGSRKIIFVGKKQRQRTRPTVQSTDTVKLFGKENSNGFRVSLLPKTIEKKTRRRAKMLMSGAHDEGANSVFAVAKI